MEKHYTIGQFKKMSGLTARTLQYDDEIGSLTAQRTEGGHRYYLESDVHTLQKIVSLKFLGFSLEETADFINKDSWNEKDSLIFQRDMMEKKREQLNNSIRLLNLAIEQIETGGTLHTDIFISMINNVHMEKSHKRWFAAFMPEPRINALFDRLKSEQETIEKKSMHLFSRLKEAMDIDPKSSEVGELAAELMEFAMEIAGDELPLLEQIPAADLEEDPWLFPYPFTPEEEQWLKQAVNHYMEKEGIQSGKN
ncbi:MerR family transcriptional regulator [Pseudobacillus badius]|uniref:MerR family transcriptional regulator n=1 Tax=Bacillus badius TaxID=1455 RepID=UPI0007B09BC8|nr:MerR family transcriptional regulator [Bacillus badius]KZO01746.1 hypothetical protein A4244_01300 [Bacillus badius]OCS90139.1 hypothetical protein A6M11_01300 [Bacillus badius]OVE53667.1 MerR family transcriptional regulator [Bacillus badius]TDW06038.1 DNA-binding transcriptional MerR regulator [Bacillus badius]UAT31900.1 MerR family transcriptional regulator [Bacillus badius]